MKLPFFVLLLFVSSCLWEQPKQTGMTFEKTQIEILRQNEPTLELTVETAVTDAQRERGLMFRTEMDDNAGMLFDFKTPRQIGMWMANTPMSLDMFFIDDKGVIRAIFEYTVPFSRDVITINKKMQAVLEMKAGSAKRLNISEGDVVKHPFFNVEK